MKNGIKRKHIAVCGMNCRLCLAYKREKNGCLGCKEKKGLRLDYCEKCKIRNCKKAVRGEWNYCFQCDEFPCKRIKHIDKRYRTNYRMSMIENLDNINHSGIRKFLLLENERPRGKPRGITERNPGPATACRGRASKNCAASCGVF
jgi:hypothetical protein